MKDWLQFVLGNKRLLNFGFLFNLFSSFGQTFFISLFVPFWVEAIHITNAALGSLYASVTIVSAFLLSLSGGYIDRMPLKKYGLIVFSGLMISVVLLSQANHLIVLAIGLLLVRWFGQGLMTHTSSTGIAKHFDVNRGKALSVTALGHPVGQFVLPLVVVPLIALIGWRFGLLTIALAAFVLVVPALWAIKPVTGFEPDIVHHDDVKEENHKNYFRTLDFWIIASNIFIIPFICTAVFLYQYSIGEGKGWDRSWITFSFAFYAVFNAVAIIVSGSLVDRFTGRKLFPLYLIPALIALLLMWITDQNWIGPLFYALLGLSSGMGSTIKTAMQVEVYGKGNLGKIRSHFSTILVVSTALGPPFFGYFLDLNWSFNAIMGISAIVVFIIVLLSIRFLKIDPKANQTINSNLI